MATNTETKNSILPFEVGEYKVEQYRVEDGLGNSLPVPKYGCLTWEENKDLNQFSLSAQNDTMMSDQAYRTGVVLLLLRKRFNISSSVTDNEILQYGENRPVLQPMIDKLYEFFDGERKRWNFVEDKSEKKANSRK
jgi:hypothetical protein